MGSVAGISRPRRRRFPGGRASKPVPFAVTFRWKTPPSVGRVEGRWSPPASPPAFFVSRTEGPLRLHADGDRTMLTESLLAVSRSDTEMRLLIIERSEERRVGKECRSRCLQ